MRRFASRSEPLAAGLRQRCAALAALALLGAGCGGSPGDVLNVHLRCDGGMTGTLSATVVPQTGEAGPEATFNLADVCEITGFGVGGYSDGDAVRFVLVRSDRQTARVVSERGDDITHDLDVETGDTAFNVILAVRNEPPFLANDTL